jgi:hypothetical protein
VQNFSTIEIAVNQETLAWLQKQAQFLTEAQNHEEPLTVPDVVVLMLERQRRAQTEHETHPLK